MPRPRPICEDRRMGHLLVLFLSVGLLILLVVGLAGMKARKTGSGTLPSDKPVAREKPSADEATPAASVTATPAQRENARRHTPPA
jgi:hypothetical protein